MLMAWHDDDDDIFPKGISSEVHVITQLEFKLSYFVIIPWGLSQLVERLFAKMGGIMKGNF